METPFSRFNHGNHHLNFPLLLAPMVGLSHIGMRLLVRSYWPQEAQSYWPTEMLNSRRLPFENLGKTLETLRESEENDLCPQILGNEKEAIQKSILKLQSWGALGIDINMGCPVQKALRHNYGVALMGDREYASRVTEFAAKSSSLPVSVKLRAGLQNDFEFLRKFVLSLEAAGASWLTLHPRLAEQKRRGHADWTQIKWVREQVKIPVVGNGDVQNADDVFRMIQETQCDAVMVGRAFTARPWLAWQVGERWGWKPPLKCEGRKAPSTPWEEGSEMGRALLLLILFMEKYFPHPMGLKKTQFFIRHCHVWLEFGHELFARATRAQTLSQMSDLVEDFFSQPHKMLSYTEWRG